MSITVWKGSTPTVQVRCENTSVYRCFSVAAVGGVLDPDELEPGTTGVLSVNDLHGRPVSEQPRVKFIGMDNSGQYLFNKLD